MPTRVSRPQVPHVGLRALCLWPLHTGGHRGAHISSRVTLTTMKMEVVMGKDIWSVQRCGAAVSMSAKEKPAGVGQKAQGSNCKPSRKKKWWAQAAAPEEGRPLAVNHPGA